jgi:acetyltransferase-like isoleucine patch superfamily enzyme
MSMNFLHLGRNILISDKCSIYSPENIQIGDNSRIDDFCVLSGNIAIGRNVHVAVFCNLAAGTSSIVLEDFAGLAFGCHIIAQSDDYSGKSMTNPTVPKRFKNESALPVSVGRHTILGAGTIVLPGVQIPEGVSSGAGTLFVTDVDAWSIYVGVPARRIKERTKDLLALEREYLEEEI